MEYTADWDWFVKRFEGMSRIDLTAYKRPQMERRINSFMRTVGVPDYKSFVDLLLNDKVVYRRFLDHITINVSEFFRNPNHWEVLEKEIVPVLLKDKNSLKVWSAGCSTGEEPYSLAMMFKGKNINISEKILATDIDMDVLEKASMGIYSDKAAQTAPDTYRNRYFTREGDFFRVNDDIKKMIKFERQDLLKDQFGRGFDLILCRNVVIYFTEETKQKLYHKFSEALRPQGVLFIGSTEQIFQARDMGLQSIATFFYKKI
ncbi:CheR family methyltransferase [Syntrophomonas palmitatica]|uniref:CheR family methyltransferase n=1 Tax=Syntrophomonas palmitatica TaxID=402877 RepID=UPI0009F8D308|nr:protein-glutamate O-methyltransferase CheR [Syntrophomonas palmitatica]